MNKIITVNHKKFDDQAGAVATAMSDIDEMESYKFAEFIKRMQDLGVLTVESTKTNKYWYQYINEGSYYQLRNGILWYISMNNDGSPEIDAGDLYASELEWDLVEGDYIDRENKVLVTDRLKEIVHELEGKE